MRQRLSPRIWREEEDTAKEIGGEEGEPRVWWSAGEEKMVCQGGERNNSL